MKKTTITFPRSHNTWSTTCPPKLIIKSKNHLIYAKEHRIWKPSFLSLLFYGKLLSYINLHPVTGWWVTNLLNPELSPFLATVQHTTSMLMPRVYESSVAWASLAPVHNKNPNIICSSGGRNMQSTGQQKHMGDHYKGFRPVKREFSTHVPLTSFNSSKVICGWWCTINCSIIWSP